MSKPNNVWKCYYCKLKNWDSRSFCQACFTENPFPLNFSTISQHLLNDRKVFHRAISGDIHIAVRDAMAHIYEYPYRHYPCIHVTGTNGKGSFVWKCAQMLQWLHNNNNNNNNNKIFKKVGIYHGPHIDSICERIMINEKYIEESVFIKYLNRILDKEYLISKYLSINNFHWFINTSNINQTTTTTTQQPPQQGQQYWNKKNQRIYLTFFEIVTLIAFMYFRDEKVDIAVIEVGMGGKYTATNMIECPLLAVITHVALDHCHILGNSIEAIAQDKCGIIKNSCDVLIGSTVPLHVVQPIVNQQHNDLYICQTPHCATAVSSSELSNHTETTTTTTTTFDFNRWNTELVKYARIPLTKSLKNLGYIQNNELYSQIDDEKLLNCRPPFRYQWISLQVCPHSEHRKVSCILDVAHNPDGIEALLRTIAAQHSSKKFILRCMVLFHKDKDVKECLNILLQKCVAGGVYFFAPLQEELQSICCSIEKAKMIAHELIDDNPQFHSNKSVQFFQWNNVDDLCQIIKPLLEPIVDCSNHSTSLPEELIVFCGSFSWMKVCEQVLSKIPLLFSMYTSSQTQINK